MALFSLFITALGSLTFLVLLALLLVFLGYVFFSGVLRHSHGH